MDNDAPRRHVLLNGHLSACETFPYMLLINEPSEVPKTTQAIATTPDCKA